MRYLALASDYDGTLAHDGVVDEATLRAVERLIHSGRRLILVTGRELHDLQSIFPRLDLCERVVAENGAVLYDPATREMRTLAARPPQNFLDHLRQSGVPGISAGDVIISTWRPYETQVMEAIRDSGLGLQIVFNKEAVMVLPPGINKMTGLSAALQELKLSPHNLAAIGDGENDHAFLDGCECAVAVANAIPALKEKADFVTQGERGAGVAELIDKIIANDLSDLADGLRGEPILIGNLDGRPVTLPRYGRNVLVCGQSGSGKSTLVTGLLERIIDLKYQLCLVDPEGDYENLPGCRTVGDERHAPSVKQLKEALDGPTEQVIVNLVAVSTSERPERFASLIAEIQELRIRTGRPHWLVVDEAHHVLPTDWAPSSPALIDQLSNVLLITVHPGHVSTAALSKINTVIIVGREPKAILEEFAKTIQFASPEAPARDLERGEALVWFRDENRLIAPLKLEPCNSEHLRHRRKYAEGELDADCSFYFRGPEGEMNLRAQNLNIFVQLADGVDQKTWLFHLKRGDYSNWLRHSLKDPELAGQLESIERDENLPHEESRKRIKEMIQKKYTAPA
jgi:hydroxymethylpyrimidine pyrophosphatase-like HAD family hydrolase/energy-coupling factor transporter ATP-binding protein EcfA2